MNTFWLKIAGAAIAIVVIIIIISTFTSGDGNDRQTTQPAKTERTFDDQVEEDRQNFLTEAKEVATTQQELANQNRTTTPTVRQPAARPQEPAEPVQLYFKELGDIEKIEAERRLNVAVPGRSIGRLPMTGFNLMVENCRQIIRRWPDSYYAYQAHRMLADIPERYKERYRITEAEMDVSKFAKPRPGTKPFTIKETR